jgi:hypothetical protein
VQEPHKSNYEYLLNLIGSLKKEIKKKVRHFDYPSHIVVILKTDKRLF